MKYLKTFEGIEDWAFTAYKKGEYVIIKSDWLKNPAKIVNVLWDMVKNTEYKLEMIPINSIDNKPLLISAEEEDIIRKATPEEIIEFEMNIAVKKYNL